MGCVRVLPPADSELRRGGRVDRGAVFRGARRVRVRPVRAQGLEVV
jgi:hypothetical protein